MDFDDWMRAGNGARDGESLYDAVGRTVSGMYGDIEPCPKCGRPTNTFKDSTGKCCCQHCNHTWFS